MSDNLPQSPANQFGEVSPGRFCQGLGWATQLAKLAGLTTIADVLAGRSHAAYCYALPVRSIAG